MHEWWRHLTGRPFYWALDGSHAAAQLLMLRYVVERPEESAVVKAARLTLAESAQVAALRGKLAMDDQAKEYDAPLWTLCMLAELGVPCAETMAEALDHLLDDEDLSPLHGASSVRNAIVLCIAAALGFADDERVLKRLATLNDMILEGTLADEAGRRADWLTLAASALAAVPESAREAIVVEKLSRYLSELNPAQLASYHQYAFPWLDRPDGLLLARSALHLGMQDPWLQPWIDRIEQSQDEQGLWRLARTPKPSYANLWGETVGEPSRWITANALYVLRAFYGE